jgi:hypothetical protein
MVQRELETFDVAMDVRDDTDFQFSLLYGAVESPALS